MGYSLPESIHGVEDTTVPLPPSTKYKGLHGVSILLSWKTELKSFREGSSSGHPEEAQSGARAGVGTLPSFFSGVKGFALV